MGPACSSEVEDSMKTWARGKDVLPAAGGQIPSLQAATSYAYNHMSRTCEAVLVDTSKAFHVSVIHDICTIFLNSVLQSVD